MDNQTCTIIPWVQTSGSLSAASFQCSIRLQARRGGVFVPPSWANYYTPGIDAEGYIVFVFPFVCSFVLASRSRNYFKVLRLSNLRGVYLANHSSESIHIWTISTLEGRLSCHDSSPQGPCPGVGLDIKI